MNIFISYTIKDKEISFDSLSSISRKLKHIGNVYIDIINNDSINKQERVFYELDNSDIVMLLITPNVYKSKWVIIELERAKERSIPIISALNFSEKNIRPLRSLTQSIPPSCFRRNGRIPICICHSGNRRPFPPGKETASRRGKAGNRKRKKRNAHCLPPPLSCRQPPGKRRGKMRKNA